MVLDGTPRVVIAICRSLHAHDIPAVIAQIGASGASLGSNAVVADVAVLDTEPGFLTSVQHLLDSYRLDTIFPCSDKALRAIVPHYLELSRRAHLACPEPDILLKVLDKADTLRIAGECRIGVPITYAIDDLETLRAIRPRLRFPMIAKPRNAGVANPFKIKYFQSFEELERFVRNSNASRTVFQEFLPGGGVGVSAIVNAGEPLVLFQHRRIHEWPVRGGVGVLVESQMLDPHLANITRGLLRRLEWRGPAMVELRWDPKNATCVLMEVNGRFWGSLPLAIAAGLDLPYFQWQLLHGVQPELPVAYKTGLKMRWTTGELRRLVELTSDSEARRALHYSRFTTVVQFVRAFDPRIRSALFSPQDPQPAIRDVARFLSTLAVGIAWTQAKKMLPDSWRRRIFQLRYLPAKPRKAYLVLWLMRSIGLRRVLSARSLKDIRRVTFVCRGNRIRSPLAAAILASRLNGSRRALQITSAGTVVDRDSTFDARAKAIADSMGLQFDGTPRHLAADLVENSDVLVVMDRVIEAEVVAQFPRAASKVCLLSEDEILDPDKVGNEEFQFRISQLIAKVDAMADRLTSAK